MFPWQWISNTAAAANFYFLGNSSLIKKVRFQRAMLVLAGVLNESVHFVVSIPVIVGFMLYYGTSAPARLAVGRAGAVGRAVADDLRPGAGDRHHAICSFAIWSGW